MELLTHISNIAYFSPHFPISVGKHAIYPPDFTTLPHEVRPLHLNHSDFITEIIPPQKVRPETNAHKSTTFLYFHPQTTPLHPTKTFFFREFSQDMLLRVPSFYNKFCCLADKCTDTCCVGWEIDVDEISLSKYRDLAENTSPKCERDEKKIAFAKILMENIQDGHFILKPGDRCPFLMKSGLCEMICKLGCNGSDLDESGESVLCDICREHPRFVEVYGDIMEKGVGLCCEEAVRLLLTSDSQDDSTICHSELYETKNFSSQVELCPLGRSTKCEVEESRILILQGNLADDTILKLLPKATRWVVYETLPVATLPDWKREAVAGADAVVFASSSAVENFMNALKLPQSTEGAASNLSAQRPHLAFSIGRLTSATAKKYDFEVVESEETSMDSLVKKITEYYAV